MSFFLQFFWGKLYKDAGDGGIGVTQKEIVTAVLFFITPSFQSEIFFFYPLVFGCESVTVILRRIGGVSRLLRRKKTGDIGGLLHSARIRILRV